MARARNIKPSFFTSEQVADNCPLGRLLFIGLWTQADYKGDVEWKARTLKIQILPWDECDIKQLAINLDKSGLIRFYSDGNNTYLNIPNFERHQNPHKNEREKGSGIPEYSDEMRQRIDLNTLAINPDKSRDKRNSSQSDRADSLLLIPESPNLNPDSLALGSSAVADKPQSMIEIQFDAIWAAYPKREGANPRNKALSAFKARIAEGIKPDDIAAGVSRYLRYCQARGSIGTEYVMQAARFLGTEKAFENDWMITEAGNAAHKPSFAKQSKSDRDDEAMRAFLARNSDTGGDDESVADTAGVEAGHIPGWQH